MFIDDIAYIFLKKSPQIFVYTYKLFTFASALDVCVVAFLMEYKAVFW